ncbi:MAG: hypothetical protein ABIR52_05170, partial [Casimicrobiaceae bacterium]
MQDLLDVRRPPLRRGRLWCLSRRNGPRKPRCAGAAFLALAACAALFAWPCGAAVTSGGPAGRAAGSAPQALDDATARASAALDASIAAALAARRDGQPRVARDALAGIDSSAATPQTRRRAYLQRARIAI